MLYTYMTTHKALLLGAMPKHGLLRMRLAEEPADDKPRMGYAIYGRELTEAEVELYQLQKVEAV